MDEEPILKLMDALPRKREKYSEKKEAPKPVKVEGFVSDNVLRCDYCGIPLKRNQTKYCSRNHAGEGKKGKKRG